MGQPGSGRTHGDIEDDLEARIFPRNHTRHGLGRVGGLLDEGIHDLGDHERSARFTGDRDLVPGDDAQTGVSGARLSGSPQRSLVGGSRTIEANRDLVRHGLMLGREVGENQGLWSWPELA